MSTVLEIANLSFAYSQNRAEKVLNILDLKIQNGERVFLQGASGSGKTTLLGLVAGVVPPQEGHIKVLEEDFTKISSSRKDKLRGSRMGYIFQLFNLIPYLSVRENIALPCHLHTERRRKLTLSLDEEVKKLCEALRIEFLMDKAVSELSVGQQQRVAAARAFIGSPELIIADEPTSALDYDLRGQFIDLLITQAEKTKATLLFVSHDPSLASFFTRKISMQDINQVAKS